jgi:hypothetical protein
MAKKAAATETTVQEQPPPTVTQESQPQVNTTQVSTALEKSKRGIRWVWRADNGLYGVVHITTEDGGWDYFMTLHTGFYELCKLEAGRGIVAIYRITLASTEACNCEGYKNHKNCKHVLGLNSLRQQNKL